VLQQLRGEGAASVSPTDDLEDESDTVQFSHGATALTSSSVYDQVAIVGYDTKSMPDIRHVKDDEVTTDMSEEKHAMRVCDHAQSIVATTAEPIHTMKRAVEEAQLQATQAKAAAREARRNRQVDEIMLMAMRKRFELRQQQNLEKHLKTSS
jgi:hypothetical protein